MTFRDNISEDRTPIQQSMTVDDRDYQTVHHVNQLMLGVILEVYPCDQEEGNRSSWQTRERRGFSHEATVLIVNDGSSPYMTMRHVMITPDSPSGMDDYMEKLPRAARGLVTGDELNAQLHQIDPYDLDADWCVVGFLGGQLDQPFVVRWWPNSRNTYDPATSGFGNPDQSGEGQALNQFRRPHTRYFRRINGVETTVTGVGNIIISTTFAGGELQLGEDPERGRYAREIVDDGGSIRVYMKPESSLEFTWDEQEDFVGPLGQLEDETPQENPPPGRRRARSGREEAYVVVTRDQMRVETPTSLELISSETMELEATDEVTISSPEGTVEVTGDGEVNVTSSSSDVSITSDTGQVALSAQTVLDLLSTGTVEVDGVTITLGNGGTDFLIKGTTLVNALTTVQSTLAAVPSASDPTTTATLANANKAALIALMSAISASLSTKTRTA